MPSGWKAICDARLVGEHQAVAAELDRPQRGGGSRFLSGPPEEFANWWRGAAEVWFSRKPGDDVLRVYTTRPDTLFGATYMVVAPEHPLLDQLTSPDQQAAVRAAYQAEAAAKSDLERTELAKEKGGVFTGSCAINPVNGRSIPIWVADYVLISYGTGAIMAVPAHDERDFEFARVHWRSSRSSSPPAMPTWMSRRSSAATPVPRSMAPPSTPEVTTD